MTAQSPKVRGNEERSNVMMLMRHDSPCKFETEDIECTCPCRLFVSELEAAASADVEARLEALKGALREIAEGRWNAPIGRKTRSFREFASAALAGPPQQTKVERVRALDEKHEKDMRQLRDESPDPRPESGERRINV